MPASTASGVTTTGIVTGGASGIGRSLARAMVPRGAHVVVADIDGDAAERVAAELDGDGRGNAAASQLDVADADAVAELVESTHARRDRLDLLFNNAGIGAAAPYATTKHGVVGDTPLLDKTQFDGLPVPPGAPVTSMRAYSAAMGIRRFYPSDRFAEDVVRGLARNRVLIVAPRSARVSWRLWRLAPELMLRLSITATRWQAR